jgi:transcriptional regulator with XRE-family HTH domain
MSTTTEKPRRNQAEAEALGERIRGLRAQANIPSTAELARRAGIDMQLVWRYEHGKVLPGLTHAVKLAAALGVTVDLLACGDSEADREVA